MFAQIISPAFADAPKYEKPLPVVSGSQSDVRTFTYNGHVVSQGLAVSTSMMAAVEPNEFSFSKAACAVSLSSTGWSEGIYSFEPWVTSIWVKVEGNSFYRVNVGAIADNTGTGGSCTSSWEILLDILLTILPYLLEYLAQEPPLKEWQSDLHWAKAIVRSKEPYEGGRIQPRHNPCVETEGCDFNSLFSQAGYQYLTITAGADIAVVRSWWARGDYLYWDVIPVNSYSVTFQVRVPVTNEPETPSMPSGPSSGNRGSSYTYSTTTIDPDGNNVRYQFDWGDSTTTTTGWYASGVTASASHSWSNLGTYQVKVRAQDVYEEWSCWSPILTLSIVDRPPNTPSTPSGPSTGYTYSTYSYSTSTTDPDGDSVRYEFNWGDGTTTTTGWYASGVTVSCSHYWSSAGTYYVKVRAQDVYLMWSSLSASKTVSISSGGGGGGGCPTLLVWDGNGYVDYGLIGIHDASGEDVVSEVPVNGEDVDINNHEAKFRLLEGRLGLTFSESFIDQVKLYAMDSYGNLYSCPLISARHNTLGNVLPQLLLSDNREVQTLLLETIDLEFMVHGKNIQSFVFVIEGCNVLKM